MIENFTPQPYPLECSGDGATWELVIGWTTIEGRVTPVLSRGTAALAEFDASEMSYRPADTRPTRAPATTAMRTPRGPSTS